MTHASELELLRREQAALTARIIEIEEAHRAAELAPLVGRCFRYRNCYSCPESDDDYWFMYTRITGILDGALQALRFQTDKHGKIEVEECDVWGTSTLGDEITAQEFSNALSAIREALASANYRAHAQLPKGTPA